MTGPRAGGTPAKTRMRLALGLAKEVAFKFCNIE